MGSRVYRICMGVPKLEEGTPGGENSMCKETEVWENMAPEAQKSDLLKVLLAIVIFGHLLYFFKLLHRGHFKNWSRTWVNVEHRYCQGNRRGSLRNVPSNPENLWHFQDSHYQDTMWCAETKTLILLHFAFSPFTLLQQLGLSFYCWPQGLRYLHTLFPVSEIFLPR